jgi:crotonobetainyl-CoA:carnitine CoA-transferase CaiB-like acyl-CoA transferase
MKILEDVRVLDFTHIWFGPYCTLMLAELGAEIIKVEPPWGESGRLRPGEPYRGVSSSFYALNLNKKDIAINLKDPKGLAIVKELIKKTDVLVQSFLPGTMERLGLGYNTIKEYNPDIIYAALSGFGQSGPYAKYPSYADITEAISGHTYATGKKHQLDGPPIRMSGDLGDLGPALFAAFSIVAALLHRNKTGRGQFIDVSQVDCMVSLNCCESVAYDLFKESPIDRLRSRTDLQSRLKGIYKVQDGWIQIHDRTKDVDNLKEKLGVEDININMLEKIVAKMTREEAIQYFAEISFPVSPVYEAYEGINDHHLLTRGMWVEVEHPKAGKYKVPNFPVKFSETPGEVTSASPLLGQHTKEILTNLLQTSNEEIIELEKQGTIVCTKNR